MLQLCRISMTATRTHAHGIVARMLVAFCLVLGFGVACADDEARYPLLRDSIDPELEKQFDEALTAEFRGSRATQFADKKAAMVVVDITDLHKPRVAEANGDLTLYAASLPKIAILFGAYALAERGELVIDDELHASMTRMIRNSSNRDATAVLKRVGFERVAELLQSDPYRLYDRQHGGGLWALLKGDSTDARRW